MMDKLLFRWRDLWQRLGAHSAPEPIFDELVRRYREPHRAYHTLDHIQDCLRQLDQVRNLAEHADEIELALWCHDVKYDQHTNYVIVEDALPAGLEAIDPTLATTAKGQPTKRYNRYDWRWSNKELRDDRVVLFSTWMPWDETLTYTYQARHHGGHVQSAAAAIVRDVRSRGDGKDGEYGDPRQGKVR